MSNSRIYLRWGLVLGWVVLLIAAFSLDRHVAQWVHDAAPVNKDARITHRILFVLKLSGNFWFTLCVATLLTFFHRRQLQATIALILSGMAVGIAYSVIKWMAGRHRPFKGIGKNVDPFGFHPFPPRLVRIVRSGKCPLLPIRPRRSIVRVGDVSGNVNAESTMDIFCSGFDNLRRAGHRKCALS